MSTEADEAGTVTYKAVLLDIEGTTTPISFVKDELFPFASAHLEEHLADHWDTDEVKADVAALRALQKTEEAAEDQRIPEGHSPEARAAVVRYVRALMAADRKVGPLKTLQGHIWKAGYKAGKIKGALFPDVRPAMEMWTKRQANIYIYSSGSVQAQQLLFTHSIEGDLTKMLCGHFDTAVGSKLEAASYSKICSVIAHPPSEVLFVTDNIKEAEAAREAGLLVVVSVRPGNAPLSAADKASFPTVTSFHQIIYDADGSPRRFAKRSRMDPDSADQQPSSSSPAK